MDNHHLFPSNDVEAGARFDQDPDSSGSVREALKANFTRLSAEILEGENQCGDVILDENHNPLVIIFKGSDQPKDEKNLDAGQNPVRLLTSDGRLVEALQKEVTGYGVLNQARTFMQRKGIIGFEGVQAYIQDGNLLYLYDQHNVGTVTGIPLEHDNAFYVATVMNDTRTLSEWIRLANKSEARKVRQVQKVETTKSAERSIQPPFEDLELPPMKSRDELPYLVTRARNDIAVANLASPFGMIGNDPERSDPGIVLASDPRDQMVFIVNKKVFCAEPPSEPEQLAMLVDFFYEGGTISLKSTAEFGYLYLHENEGAPLISVQVNQDIGLVRPLFPITVTEMTEEDALLAFERAREFAATPSKAHALFKNM